MGEQETYELDLVDKLDFLKKVLRAHELVICSLRRARFHAYGLERAFNLFGDRFECCNRDHFRAWSCLLRLVEVIAVDLLDAIGMFFGDADVVLDHELRQSTAVD